MTTLIGNIDKLLMNTNKNFKRGYLKGLELKELNVKDSLLSSFIDVTHGQTKKSASLNAARTLCCGTLSPVLSPPPARYLPISRPGLKWWSIAAWGIRVVLFLHPAWTSPAATQQCLMTTYSMWTAKRVWIQKQCLITLQLFHHWWLMTPERPATPSWSQINGPHPSVGCYSYSILLSGHKVRTMHFSCVRTNSLNLSCQKLIFPNLAKKRKEKYLNCCKWLVGI